MTRTILYKIKKEYEGRKISEFLKEHFYSSKFLTKLRHIDNTIRLNGEFVYMNTKLSDGDQLEIIYTEEPEPSSIVPVMLDFEIVYEDEDILIINKPFNMPVHPSINNYENTLANGIAYYFESKNQKFTFRCINRLDKDTTGLLIVAKHQLSAAVLSYFMKNRMIKREYLAIASGIFEDKSGTVNEKIGRHNNSLIERCIDNENGETAVTHYEVIKELSLNDLYSRNQTFSGSDSSPSNKVLGNASSINSNNYNYNYNYNHKNNNNCKYASLLKIHLDTGRTHQIRVHMKHLGHPLLGDSLYNDAYDGFERQALHSYSLSFKHPVTLEEMYFKQNMSFHGKVFSLD